MLNKEFCVKIYNRINEEVTSIIYDLKPSEEEVENLIIEKDGLSASIEERYYISKIHK
jgi:hypothetical protein